jgi:hypothetical protein
MVAESADGEIILGKERGGGGERDGNLYSGVGKGG